MKIYVAVPYEFEDSDVLSEMKFGRTQEKALEKYTEALRDRFEEIQDLKIETTVDSDWNDQIEVRATGIDPMNEYIYSDDGKFLYEEMIQIRCIHLED